MTTYLYDPLCFLVWLYNVLGGASYRSPDDPQPGESMTTTAGAPGLCVSTRLYSSEALFLMAKKAN